MKPFLSWHRWVCWLLVWSAALLSQPLRAQSNAPFYEAPPIEVASYLGGSGVESAAGVAVNRNGDVYIVANTDSDDFAWQGNDQYLRAAKDGAPAQSTLERDYSRRTQPGVLNARPELDRGETEQRSERGDDYSARDGRWDFMVIKLSNRGTRIEWVARFGGAGDDFARGIAVDERGNAYIGGTTDSPDLFDGIADNAGASRFNGRRDAFLLKLDAQGARVEYGAYLGGSNDDFCRAVAVDRQGRAVLVGDTASEDFPARNGLQNRSRGRVDAWAARFDARGGAVEWATYLGGSEDDFGRAVAIAEDGAVWLAGDTSSADFPTRFGAQSTYGGEGDAWLARLNASGSFLEYASFVGGSGADAARGLATRSGRAVVVGYTASTDFSTRNGLPSMVRGRWDVFIAQAEKNRTDWNFSTTLGGSEADFASSVAIDARGDILVAGQTFSPDFPSRGFVAQRGGAEAFVAKILTATSGAMPIGTQSTLRLLWTALLGGSENEASRGVAVDARGQVFVVGQTSSPDFPLRLALQTDNAGRDDLFVARFDGSGRGHEPFPDAPYTPAPYNPYPYEPSPNEPYPQPYYPSPGYPHDPYYDPYRDPYDEPYRGRARLELRLSQDVVSETAGARRVYGEVYRYVPDGAAFWDYNRDRAMTVYLESTDPRRVRVPETVTISRRRRSGSFPIEIIDTERDDGNSDITIYARKPGFQNAEAILRVKDNDSASLSLSISPNTFRESGGPRASKGVVRRNTSYRGALRIELFSSDALRVRVPSHVTIPDGSPIVAFPIEAVAGATEGAQSVTITARARGFREATAGVSVTDDDRVDARLTISLNQSTLREEKGERAAIATITRNALTEQAMTIEVFSSDTSRLRVPNTVVIAARSTSVQFAIATIDNGLREGTREVTITARKPAFQSATVTVQIVDDESGTTPTPRPTPIPIVQPTPRPTPTERPEAVSLNIRLNASSVSERGTVTGVVRRTGNSNSAMTVYLSSSDSSEARVPSSVVIPAGATEATFMISAIRDGIVDGTRQVRISASKSGLGSDTTVLSILDEDKALPAAIDRDKSDPQARERAQREKADREKVEQEKAAREKAERERVEQEKTAREKREKEEQDKAERLRRDKELRDREAKDREIKDREIKDREIKDREIKDRAARDKEVRDKEAREREKREREVQEKAAREKVERDKREKEERERESKSKPVKPKERRGIELP